MFYPEVGEINAHAQTVCTRPSPPPILEGLGIRLVKFHTHYSVPAFGKYFLLRKRKIGIHQPVCYKTGLFLHGGLNMHQLMHHSRCTICELFKGHSGEANTA